MTQATKSQRTCKQQAKYKGQNSGEAGQGDQTGAENQQSCDGKWRTEWGAENDQIRKTPEQRVRAAE